MWCLLKRRGYYEEDVLEGYRKMKLIVLRIVGGYPDLVDRFWFSVFYCTIYYLALLFCTASLFNSAYYTIKMKEMNLMSEMMFRCCYLVFYTFALFNTHWHRDYLDEMLRIIGKSFYKYSTPKSDAQRRGLKADLSTYQRFRNWYTIFLIPSELYMGWFFPILKVISSGRYSTVTEDSVPFNTHLPLGLSLPVDTSTFTSFCFMFIFEGILTNYVGLLLWAINTTMVNFISELCAQINMLSQSLNEISERAIQIYKVTKGNSEFDEEEYQKSFYKALIENIKHHQVLVQYHKALQSFLAPWVFVLFLGSGLTICVSGYLLMNRKITSGNSVVPMFMDIMDLTDAIIIIFIYSWFSEKLSITSEEYERALYNTPWPDRSREFKEALRQVMAFSQKTDMRLRVSSIAVYSLDTFSQILKRGYSYLNVLNATN